MRLEIFGCLMLLVIAGLFSGVYHMFVSQQDQLRIIQSTTGTTSSGVISIQLRLKTLESAILNYDHEKPIEK
jgi:high-affinity Fe2+/Pb2+ permease